MSTKDSKGIFPSVVPDGVYIGMSEEDFKEKLKDQVFDEVTNESFRTSYITKVGAQNVEYIVYYFDQDGDRPLYEVIIIYDTEKSRDTEAVNLFGTPNHEEVEWRMTRPGQFNVWSWTYKTLN